MSLVRHSVTKTYLRNESMIGVWSAASCTWPSPTQPTLLTLYCSNYPLNSPKNYWRQSCTYEKQSITKTIRSYVTFMVEKSVSSGHWRLTSPLAPAILEWISYTYRMYQKHVKYTITLICLHSEMYQTQSCFSEARKIVPSTTRNVSLRVSFYGSNRWIYLIYHPTTYQRNGLTAMLFIWRYCGSPLESRLHIWFRKFYKLKNERQSMIDVCNEVENAFPIFKVSCLVRVHTHSHHNGHNKMIFAVSTCDK